MSGFHKAWTDARESFAVETTLRTAAAIEQARTAKTAGFTLEMIFVSTNDVEVNINRVMERGATGGHSAPVERIRHIYEESLRNLPEAILVFDKVLLVDNTEVLFTDHMRPKRVAKILRTPKGLVAWQRPPLPGWCESVLNHPRLGIEVLRRRSWR